LLLDAGLDTAAILQHMLPVSANVRHMYLLRQLGPTPIVLPCRPTAHAEMAAIRA